MTGARAWVARGGRASSIALIATTAGCLDLVPVEPPAFRPAALQVSIQLGEGVAERGSEPVTVRVTANLDTGVDPIGRTRGVTNDTLWVVGFPLVPNEVRPRGQRTYAAEFVVLPDQLFTAPIPIRPPALVELTPTPVTIRWPILWRDGPGLIVAGAGADLALSVGVTTPTEPPQPARRQWSFAFFHAGGWSSMGAEEPVPAVVTVPAQLVGPPGGIRLGILNSSQTAELDVGAGAYLLRIELTQATRWTVSVVEAE